MDKVRVACIGCGSITRYRHAPEYANHPDVEIVAFADRHIERAEKLATQYGAKAYDKWQDVIALKNVDAVSVCTSNVTHGPITIAAMEAGKHVLCEKPMATSDEEVGLLFVFVLCLGLFLLF